MVNMPSNTDDITDAECGDKYTSTTFYPLSFSPASLLSSTTLTASDLPGTGRILDKYFFSRAGRNIEVVIGRLAHRAGWGPSAAARRIEAALVSYSPERRPLLLYALMAKKRPEVHGMNGVPPSVLEKLGANKVDEDCRKLLRYTKSKVISTKIVALYHIISLIARNPGIGSCFSSSEVLQQDKATVQQSRLAGDVVDTVALLEQNVALRLTDSDFAQNAVIQLRHHSGFGMTAVDEHLWCIAVGDDFGCGDPEEIAWFTIDRLRSFDKDIQRASLQTIIDTITAYPTYWRRIYSSHSAVSILKEFPSKLGGREDYTFEEIQSLTHLSRKALRCVEDNAMNVLVDTLVATGYLESDSNDFRQYSDQETQVGMILQVLDLCSSPDPDLAFVAVRLSQTVLVPLLHWYRLFTLSASFWRTLCTKITRLCSRAVNNTGLDEGGVSAIDGLADTVLHLIKYGMLRYMQFAAAGLWDTPPLDAEALRGVATHFSSPEIADRFPVSSALIKDWKRVLDDYTGGGAAKYLQAAPTISTAEKL